MALLGREQILQADDLPVEDVPVPEWRGEVRLRGLTGAELDEYQASLVVQTRDGTQKANLRNATAKLVSRCAIDEDGAPLFEPKDLLKLSSKSAVALQRLFAVAQKLNGLTDDDMRELVEDFSDDPSGSLPSD
ncbi:hypothetical protein [Streptosporangium sp. NPDC020145]|uniref:hypothetical protein n=1 Tax=Streptosporangium sp. NPDC020145 TaxID=3154694 RepID=UPI0034245882